MAATSRSSDEPVATPPRFAVVGIGASAGGLSALLGLLEHLPADCGIAFVVVLHLPAMDSEAMLPILARGTSMPVVLLSDAASLEPDHLYLVPHLRVLVADETSLRSFEPKNHSDPRTSIDQFFRTLADAYGGRCVGVLLSGTRSEGVVGLAHIREQGGVTIAQAPEDADHDGLPRAAIASGAVDLILPVSEMAGRLVKLRHGADEAGLPPDQESLEEIMEILRLRTRHEFGHYKQATVLRRIRRRLQINGLPDLSSYRDFLRNHADKAPLLLQDMLISVTSFFRDPAAMDALQRNVLRNLLQSHPRDKPIRIWVVGCATGEEAYSVSIQMHELAAATGRNPDLQVFATDIDERALAVARDGLYPGAIANDVSIARLAAFFVQEEQHYRVNPVIRASVLFTSHNVLHDPPFSRLDLILCRNLLIYLQRDAQAGLLRTFSYALNPGGHLFLGRSETTGSASPGDAFTAVDEENRIYAVNADRADVAVPDRLVTPSGSTAAPGKRSTASGKTAALGPPGAAAARMEAPAEAPTQPGAEALELHRRILAESAPASVLVDADLAILHMTSGAAQFMVHTSGSPSSALMSNIHPDLRVELRLALLSAGKSGTPVQVRDIPVLWRRGELSERGLVDIRVVPHRDAATDADFSMILLEATALPQAAPGDVDDGEGAAEGHRNAGEAGRVKEQLRQTITQFDRSSEALRGSNAKLEASNAALRVAAEELATREEELQSLNEELIAVNREFKAKVDETARINDDLQNLVAAASVVALFVDRGMSIRRYTPSAGLLFSLGSTGTGRRLQEVARQLEQAPLEEDAAESMRTLQPMERSVRGNDGRFYLARTQPYRTMRDSIEGVVLSLRDVTNLQQTGHAVRDVAEVLRLVFESAGDLAAVRLSQQGRIASWDSAASRLLGYEEQEILEQPFEALAAAEEGDRGAPQELFRLAREHGSAQREQRFRRKDGSTFAGSCTITALHQDPAQGFVQAIRDLSDLRAVQSQRDQLLIRERSLEDRLAAARRRRDEFLHVLAGELKRPLNLVQVNAEMLLRLPETRGIAVAGKIAGSIGKAVASQSQIIDTLRDLSLARSGKLILEMRSVDLRGLVEDVVKSRQQQAAAKSLSLEFLCDRDPLVVVCDPARVEQIVRNLIANAIKFTRHGGITVRIGRDGDFACLTVADTGMGIAPELLEAVFDADDVAEGPLLPNKGLGVGLPLVRELVAAHDGKIVAESDGAERGATFTVWLRLTALPHAPEPEPPAGGNNPLWGLRVVLVDDSLDLLTALSALLTSEGAHVETFDTGDAALERLMKGDVDLLISDLGMPGMDGYELIARVRRQVQLANLPAIALTGYGRTRDPGHAVRSGFNAHTTKPVALEELKSIVSLLRSL